MKKKILFLIFLLIPFIVKAEDIDSLHLTWRAEDYFDPTKNYYYYEYFDMKDSFIFIRNDLLKSIDKKKGTTKEISKDGTFIKINDNKIINIKSETDKVSLIQYDEYLNIISKEDINDYYNSYLSNYNDDTLILTGNKGNGDIVVYFIDYNGNIIKTIEKTNSSTNYSEIELCNHLDEDDLYLIDKNDNIFLLENDEITPINTNSDGSYMYLTDTKLYKKTATGETIDELEIPDGKGTRIIKYNYYYYVATGIYTPGSGNKFNIKLKIYKIDEDLNIINTTTTTNDEYYNVDYVFELPKSMTRYYHNIYTSDNKLYCEISYGSGHTYYYEIDDNLSLTKLTNNYKYFEYYTYSSFLNYNWTVSYPNRVLTDEQESYIYQYVTSNFGNYPKYNYVTDGTNIYVGVINNISLDNGVERKGSLLIFDNNLNLLLNKTIFDSNNYDINEIDFFDTYKDSYITMQIFEDYIVVGTSTTTTNIIRLYDKNGNVIKDFSNDVKDYKIISPVDIIIKNNGFYVRLDTVQSAAAGVSTEVNNVLGATKVLGTNYNPNEPAYAWLYYSKEYSIKTNIIGSGNITANEQLAPKGTNIEFTVTPAPGYVLSVVKVTDANGNVLTFTNNTFVMPSSDVIIEATFVPINPKTSDIAILTILLITLSSLVIFALEKRRLNTLK